MPKIARYREQDCQTVSLFVSPLAKPKEDIGVNMRITIYFVSCLLSSALGGMAVLGWLSIGQAELYIKALTIVDDNGQVRASLKVRDSGISSLYLMDPNSQLKLMLSASEDGSSRIALFNKSERPAFLATIEEEEPSLYFYDNSKKEPRIALGLVNDEAGIVVNDRSGKTHWSSFYFNSKN